MTSEQDRRIGDAFTREEKRLRSFIRKRVADDRDAEDILQDVFYELVEASRLLGISRKGLFLKRRRWGLRQAS